MRRSAAVLTTSLALVIGATASPAAAADAGASSTPALSGRAGTGTQANLHALVRPLTITRTVPRTVPGITALPKRAPGAQVLTDILQRPVAPTTLTRTSTTWSPPTIRTSAANAYAATRVHWGHPDDVRAVEWSKQTARAIEVQVDRALAVLLPQGAPLWLRIELRRASLVAMKTTFCSGLEAVVLRPDGQVSVDLRQVLAEVLRTSRTAHLPRAMAARSNMDAWVKSMTDTVSNVSRSAVLADREGDPWSFNPLAYQGLVRAGFHPLALRTVLPQVFDGTRRHLTRAAFVLARLCYAPPRL